MEARHRIAAGREAGCSMSVPGARALVRSAAGLVLAGLVAACQVPAGDAESPATALATGAMEMESQPAPEKLPILGNLAVGEGSGTRAAARVMERLAAIMPPDELAAVRTFNLFPVIALDASGELIARLLAMPEVASIERDREIRLPEPQPGLKTR